MVVVRSSTTVEVDRRRESTACSCGSSARTRSTVSMMLAPGWRKMISEHRRLAVRRARRCACPRPSRRRRATSDSCTGGAVAVGDDQRRVLVGLAAAGRWRESSRRRSSSVELALRAVRVGAAERAAHVLEADAVAVERSRVHLDAHRRQRAAADDHLADALRPATASAAGCVEAASYICAAVERVGGERQDHDRRVGRVDLAVGRDCSAGWRAGCRARR